MIAPPPALAAALDDVGGTVPGAALRSQVSGLRDGYRVTGAAADLTREAAVAYAVYRLPATYAAVGRALSAVGASVPSLRPRTVLDLGGGSGAGAWAVRERWPGAAVRVIDRDRAMLEVGRELGRSLDGVTWHRGDLREVDGRADLVLLSYSLGELDEAARAALVQRLPGLAQTVLIVEPGTPRGFGTVLGARETWRAAGHALAAPCPHEQACPMAARNDWCHFDVRLPRSAVHRRVKGGELGYEDEKFAFVATTILPVTRPPARIVRHPQLRSGHVRLTLCRSDGLAEQTIGRSDKTTYRAARNARWGDAWHG